MTDDLEPTETPNGADVPDGVPTIPEGAIPDHVTPPNDDDWADGSADDAITDPSVVSVEEPTDPSVADPTEEDA
jgi:hypothetical protein